MSILFIFVYHPSFLLLCCVCGSSSKREGRTAESWFFFLRFFARFFSARHTDGRTAATVSEGATSRLTRGGARVEFRVNFALSSFLELEPRTGPAPPFMQVDKMLASFDGMMPL